jgi:hypothetical protein
VKTDGRYVYMVANGALRIVEALTAKPVSVTRIQGHPSDMVVEGDRVVVFVSSGVGRERCTYGYDCEIAGDGTSTTLLTYDVHDRANPRKIRTIGLTGSLMTARRIGSTVHAVVADGDSATDGITTWPDDIEMCGTREDVVQKKFFALRAQNERILRAATILPTITDRGATKELCMGLLESRFDKSHTFTTVVSFDMNDAESPATTSTIRSRPGVVYASNDALYVATHRRKSRGTSRKMLKVEGGGSTRTRGNLGLQTERNRHEEACQRSPPKPSVVVDAGAVAPRRRDPRRSSRLGASTRHAGDRDDARGRAHAALRRALQARRISVGDPGGFDAG